MDMCRFPFYYEIKVVLVFWLLSPATKGSSILYRNFVHPALIKREQEIDEYISKAKEQGYHTMLHLGSKGVTYATSMIMQTAIKSSEPLAVGDTTDRGDAEMAETSDDSRPSTPPPSTTQPPPSSPAHNTRSRKTRSRNTAKAK
ncbi:Receptor expression-enhancing protein 2 [Homalodisca vitripennis]|nr:Receptor expression-enhancing protein 2 [Homalodisca vitripennis]KAG8334282.1 Receptor expression-enhancing protein 2 [Homalodisca vitripennis]